MNTYNSPRKNAGFSLMEVLVAVIVLSFGLLSLAALQGALFKASTESKAQSVALALATEKLEYFRGYRDTATYQAITSGNDPNNPISIGGVDYTRTWTVNRYAYPAAGGTFTAVANTGALSTTAYAVNNEFKRVQVSVTWNDAEGKAQYVTLEDAIASLNPEDSRKIAKNLTGTRPRGPEVRIYNPSLQEGVIPIALGNSGTDTAATNPKPLVNGSSVVETRFDVLTYTGSGATAVSQSRVETSIVGCSCDYGAQTDTSLRGKRPTYWDGTRYVEPEAADFMAPAGVRSGAAQSDMCVICCRDHHDPASLQTGAARFDPRNGNHNQGHFLLNSTTGVLTGPVLSGQYTESCRVIRVGGSFRVAADTYNDYMNVLNTKSLGLDVTSADSAKSEYVPTATATTNYQNFVKAYLDARVVTATSGYNNRPTGISTIESANSINTLTPVDLHASDTKWTHLRGLYIDYLEDAAVQAINDAKTNCQGTGGAAPTAIQLQTCVLQVLPFTSINLTELGKWTPAKVGDAGLSQIVVAGYNCSDAVTGNPCTFDTTLTSVQPIRGKVTPGSSPTNGTQTDALATMRRSNSGLTTLVGGIDTEDASTSTPSTWTAAQPFTYRGTSGGSGGTFTVNLAGYTYDPANLAKQYINVFPSATCNASATGNPWSCTSASGMGVPRTLTLGNYNYVVPLTSGGLTLNCTNPSTGTTFPHTFGTNGQGVQKINVCKNFQVVSSDHGGSPGLATTPDGALTESTPVAYTAINDTDVLTITLQAQPDTKSYTCTFTGNSGQEGTDSKYLVSAGATCP